MSRVQVLDVGDEVMWGEEPSIVLESDAETTTIAVLANKTIHEVDSNDLTRIGGSLQIGDFVRVTGAIEPFDEDADCQDVQQEQAILVEVVGANDCLIHLFRVMEHEIYFARAADLTRVTRAEALV